MTAAPRRLGGYLLQERIGVGGMAEIFRAVRSGPGQFEKTVAVKLVLPDLARDADFVRMFLHEAQLAARLSSPNLVQVFDFGEQNGVHFLVMEHVDGTDLATLLSQVGPLPVAVAVHLGRQLCAALADLHQAVDPQGQRLGIVHRDVNPGNVLLSTAGEVKLGDFGIAKARARGVRTARGAIKGKLAYLSPEQVRGDEVDHRTDLYGVGLVLFEALCGARYLEADDDAGLLRLAGKPTFRAPSELRPAVPRWLDKVLRRVLASEPAGRHADARQLDEALRRGADADVANLRARLGELVRQAVAPARGIDRRRDRETSDTAIEIDSRPDETAPPDAAAALNSEQAAARVDRQRARPRTERLVAGRERRVRWSRVGVLVAGVLAASATVVALVARRTAPEELWHAAPAADGSTVPRTAPAPTGLAADGTIAVSLAPAPESNAGAVQVTDTGAGAARDARPGAARGRGKQHSARRRPAQVHATAPVVAADASSHAHRSDARAQLPAGDAAPAARPQRPLAEVDRLLADKGILPADAPAIFAERQAVAGLVAGTDATDPALQARLSRLVERVRALAVDREFVNAKLRRLDRALTAARLDGDRAVALRRRARQALSYAVTGRYTEANRELNSIARGIAGR